MSLTSISCVHNLILPSPFSPSIHPYCCSLYYPAASLNFFTSTGSVHQLLGWLMRSTPTALFINYPPRPAHCQVLCTPSEVATLHHRVVGEFFIHPSVKEGTAASGRSTPPMLLPQAFLASSAVHLVLQQRCRCSHLMRPHLPTLHKPFPLRSRRC